MKNVNKPATSWSSVGKMLMACIIGLSVLFTACVEESTSGDEPIVLDPIADFSTAQDPDNFLKITFTNKSIAAVSYTWDFGDGSTSTDKDTEHTYAKEGTYTVKLSVKNSAGKEISKTADVVLAASNPISGNGSKIWKLHRKGVSFYVGSSEAAKSQYLALTNDGSRTCLYNQEWVFNGDGTYKFKHNGGFWGEYGPFGTSSDEHANFDACFDAAAVNMKNFKDEDVSDWLTEDHTYTYDLSAGKLVLMGMGAWIGSPKLAGGEVGETNVPIDKIEPTSATIEEKEGYDLLKVVFDLPGVYNEIIYVSYDNWDDEPVIDVPIEGDEPIEEPKEEEQMERTDKSLATEDLTDDFAGTAAEKLMFTANDGLVFEVGVDNPDATGNAAAKVGKYERVGTAEAYYQNLGAELPYLIDLSQRRKFSMKIYAPSSNDYTTETPAEEAPSWAGARPLAKTVALRLENKMHEGNSYISRAEVSFTLTDDQLDKWVELEFDFSDFDIDTDLDGVKGTKVQEVKFYDKVILQIGGEGHTRPGTFYISDFKLL